MINVEKMKSIAAVRGNSPCVVDHKTSYTWNQIIAKANMRVAFLKTICNKQQLQTACYLSHNSVDVICWLSAFSTLGIQANGLDYSLPVDKLATLIRKISPSILLVSFNLYSQKELNQLASTGVTLLAVDAPTDPVIDAIGEVHVPEIDSLMREHRPAPFRAVSLTSGTSGLPKIALRYRSFDSRRFTWFTNRYSFNNNDGFMLMLPLYHAAGNGWARMFMGLGSTLYLVDQNDEKFISYILSLDRVTASVMTPNLVGKITQIVRSEKIITHLRWVLVGGSYFSVKNKQAAIAALGPVFYEYYGCTESGVNVLSEPEDIILHPDSVGRPFDGNQVLILDEACNSVEVGESGRVAIASYMLMDEYGDGSKPFVSINNENYFLMADYGYLDHENRLFLMNRNGDSWNHQNVYGIEENIRTLPCITDVAVISLIENGKPQLKCVFSTSHKENVEKLINKIKEKTSIYNITNFKLRAVEKIPYSPSGKVRFNEIISILNAA
ncbi:AMP-binding protein [Sodalis ligni]|jgi:long-chain acyl-CoA synthetase|uniref:Acyl-CoA synthetase (AMP-forming)/AMP-acid ligase II n=1 Tax=Sodalis ligni TaxID=2697027 RepID=A0A4R1NBV8_9GAMM|nr:class I adenylate-forming enzyme family protein [Sodalis ligni]TCL03121.1 acyl-CoA synthetase (AMP-forming)/AMP-acid ligase II [Sodalis ligni]